MSSTNYAGALGISNKWAPIVFTVLYFLLMVYYIAQAIRRHASIYGGLAFFSAMRVVAYSLRAAMANNSHDATNKGVAIAYEVLYSVGYFSLVLSAYRLLRDRERLYALTRAGNRFTGAIHRGHLVHFLLFLAVVLGTVGVVYALGNYGHNAAGNGLNSASTYIFLAVTVFVALLTFIVIRVERTFRRSPATGAADVPPMGATHHHLILLIIAALLLIRTLFYAVTVHDRLHGESFTTTKQSNEHLWYPLAALAELLVALLFIVPGLVPLQSLLRRRNNYANGTEVNEKRGVVGQDNTAYGAQNGYPANGAGPMVNNGYSGNAAGAV